VIVSFTGAVTPDCAGVSCDGSNAITPSGGVRSTTKLALCAVALGSFPPYSTESEAL
jgi:hypothetical protein